MIITFLVLLAIGLFILVVFLDVAFSIFHIGNKSGLNRVFTCSSNFSLLSYEIPILLLVIVFPSFVEESQNPLLQDMFPTIGTQISGWAIVMLFLALLNIVRFERLGLDKRGEKSVYLVAEEIVEMANSPNEGLKEGLEYIQNCSNRFRAVSERGFLMYLLKRNDAISEIADKKLRILSESP